MIALTNGKIMTMTGETIAKGTLLMAEGKIVAVGENLSIPAGAEVLDVQGKLITPGFIDVHTHLGIEEEIHPEGEDTNEMTDPLTPALRAVDGVNPRDIGFQDAREAGVTTVMITMGSANVIGGVTTVMKTAGRDLRDMVVNEVAGLKMAFGENPKRVYSEQKKAPTTRMATMALARQAFYDAQAYRKKKEEDGLDLGHEHILMALDKKIPVRLHAHRADDILSAIRLRDEFGLDMVIEHCTEGHLIVPELQAAGVPAAVGPSLSNRAKVEMEHVTFATPGILAQAGVPVALITDHPCTPINYLPLCAGLAMRAGMSEADAFRALTINAARMLRLSDRLGSLAPGMDADLVVWDGHPFTIAGKAERVYVNGVCVAGTAVAQQ